MHEMSYMVRLVNKAAESAVERGAARVNRIVVSVGEMTDVLPEYLHRYYPTAVKGTLLEGSVLETRKEPVRIRCGGCGSTYHPGKENSYACPDCGDISGTVVSGRSVVLEQVEMEWENEE